MVAVVVMVVMGVMDSADYERTGRSKQEGWDEGKDKRTDDSSDKEKRRQNTSTFTSNGPMADVATMCHSLLS